MTPTQELFTIPREEAAARVGVSTRTLDRWLKSGKLRSHTIGRNIFVSDKDLTALGKSATAAEKTPPTTRTNPKPAPRPAAPTAVKTHPTFAPTAEPATRQEAPNTHETLAAVRVSAAEEVYKKLYEEAASDLKMKQEKLEAAGFRVGQLEAQLKNSVPVLALKQAEETLQRENSDLRVRLSKVELRSWLFLGGAVVAAGAAIVLAVVQF